MAGAPMRELDDQTALHAETIDVRARLGWTVRMARLTAEGRPVSRDALAARITASGRPTNASQLVRLENGERHGDLYDAYETALGLSAGQVRVPVDVLCRTYPYSPADHQTAGPLEVSTVSGHLDDLLDGPRDGGAWLRWARSLNRPDARGFPLRYLAPLLDGLISEVGRACGPGYPARYEALTLLRSGPYHQAVLDAAGRAVEDPDVQVLIDTFSAVTDHPTAAMQPWLARCLADPRPQVVLGACLGVINAAEVAGWVEDDWAAYTDPVREALGVAGPESRATLTNLLQQFPTALRSDLREVTAARSSAAHHHVLAGKDPDANPAWREASTLSEQVTTAIGLARQPLLTRLLFDVVFDQREHRAVTSYTLLKALPFLEQVIEALAVRAARDESALATRILGRIAQMRTGIAPAALHTIEPSADPAREAWRLVALAYSGVAPALDAVRPILASTGRPRRLAVLTLGLSDHDLLHELVEDPDTKLAGSARWWVEQGGLVRDRATTVHRPALMDR